MATQAVTSGSEDKLGSTVMAGNSPRSVINSLDRLTVGVSAYSDNDTLPKDALATNQKVVSAGAFAYKRTTPLVQFYSTDVGGVASDALKYADAPNSVRRRLHKKESQTTILTATTIRDNQWSSISGTWVNGSPPATGTDTFGPDHSASVTGELSYLYGSYTDPTNADYVAKTLGNPGV